MNKIKYKVYEVLEGSLDGRRFKIIGYMKDEDFWKRYINDNILSIKNYDDTKTTSIIVHNKELDK